ncbi:unnamed protein product [Notodromas monacha]|uniref:Rhodanese domain-containing protein n=1 Tax=Notodromas monacha TaxID=399045 RepID=A0A7R9BWY8_9CRUS|nr:unnamed protein product [Notodromas monacha]CAG0921748.1 unnamed protein product [Notodromas monacha]
MMSLDAVRTVSPEQVAAIARSSVAQISIRDFVRKVCDVDVTDLWEMIVYDQSSPNLDAVAVDSFLHVLLAKLVGAFRSVSLLKGGFLEFQAKFPDLCEDKGRRGGIGASGGGAALLGSFSQPCLPVTNVGPTRILPFLYLGSQQDALNRELLQVSQLVFSAPMYRTQSCPGMLPSEDSSLRSTDGGGSEGDSDSDIRLFRRRRRRERIDSDMTGAARHYDLCFDRSKNRNRYSCGNLEFDSCPDIPHFRGCQSAFPSPHGSSSSLHVLLFSPTGIRVGTWSSTVARTSRTSADARAPFRRRTVAHPRCRCRRRLVRTGLHQSSKSPDAVSRKKKRMPERLSVAAR